MAMVEWLDEGRAGTPRTLKSLIVNADDFGAGRGINPGVVEAHRKGILTSASMMVDAPASAEAARLCRAPPGPERRPARGDSSSRHDRSGGRGRTTARALRRADRPAADAHRRASQRPSRRAPASGLSRGGRAPRTPAPGPLRRAPHREVLRPVGRRDASGAGQLGGFRAHRRPQRSRTASTSSAVTPATWTRSSCPRTPASARPSSRRSATPSVAALLSEQGIRLLSFREVPDQ